MEPNGKLQAFVRNLKKTYESDLESVVLYGSAAAGDFQGKRSDLNLIVVLQELSTGELRKGARLVRRWSGKGHPVPLFIDREHIGRSTDIFPIEFLDIRETHQVLYGPDPFRDLTIRPEHLRLQCEMELKGKLIALRSQYLRASGSRRRVRGLLLDAVPGLFAVLRGILRLLGEKPGSRKEETFAKLGGRIGCDVTILGDLLTARSGQRKIGRGEVEAWMERTLTTVEAISTFVDQLQK